MVDAASLLLADYRTVGVIVGRFQTPELHAGHRYLIDTVRSLHHDVFVVLGSPRFALLTRRDPMDFLTRRLMMHKAYSRVEIGALADCGSDTVWSEALDALITERYPHFDAVLYGSRDSFVPYYKGKWRAIELPSYQEEVSATSLRQETGLTVRDTADFRRGIIYAASARPGVVFPTVDIAIIDRAQSRVLLGARRTESGHLRFFGGFVDAEDESLEQAALREAMEEAGSMTLESLRYLGSHRVRDPRYWGTKDGIFTSLFAVEYVSGDPEAGDDIDEVEWVPFSDAPSRLIQEHVPLWNILAAFLGIPECAVSPSLMKGGSHGRFQHHPCDR